MEDGKKAALIFTLTLREVEEFFEVSDIVGAPTTARPYFSEDEVGDLVKGIWAAIRG